MGLSIGPLTVDPPVVLAPMAGITNAAFRALCRDLARVEDRAPRSGNGRGCLYVSEMITARGLVEGNPRTQEMLRFADGESPRSVQLYGVDPATMAEAARRLTGEHGVDHIDMNFGCPVPKVTRKGGGAALPLHHVLLARIVERVVAAAAPVPVTVKFRKGVDDEHLTFLRTGEIAEDAGAAAVALHARTAAQSYSGTADWPAIAELKARVRSIPVLGNGDIWEARDALRMVAATGCDGVVVGRGCLGRPWLFGELASAFAGAGVAPAPPLGVALDALRRHARLLVEHLGPARGVRDLRKHVSWYLLGYPVGAAARQALPAVRTLDELERLLDRLDPGLTIPGGRAPSPRGTTNGPRRVVLPQGWLDDVEDPRPPAGAELVASGG